MICNGQTDGAILIFPGNKNFFHGGGGGGGGGICNGGTGGRCDFNNFSDFFFYKQPKSKKI